MTIDLQAFCFKDETASRFYSLGKPFSKGDYTYATDGHIMVRVDRRGDVPESESAQNAEAVIQRATQLGVFVSMPPVELPPAPEPEEKECWQCCGSGYQHDCPDCECTCGTCDGIGRTKTEEQLSVGIGKATFAAQYVRLMLSLPDLEVCPPSDSEPMQFKFAGGIGLLMGVRKQFENHITALPG